MALAAHYAGASVKLCTVIADDDVGDLLLRKIEGEGLSTDGIIKLRSSENVQTGTYVGNYDASMHLLFGMADVSLMDDPSIGDRQRWMSLFSETEPKWILIDTCFPANVSSTIIACARKVKAQIFVEIVSVPRARSMLEWIETPSHLYPHCSLDVVSLNDLELKAMYECASAGQLFQPAEYVNVIKQLNVSNTAITLAQLSYPDVVCDIAIKATTLLPYMKTILVTLGEHGCVLTMLIPRGDRRLSEKSYAPHLIQGQPSAPGTIFVKHYPLIASAPKDEILSVNGAGDSFKGALLSRIVSCATDSEREAMLEDEAHIHFAQAAAACSIRYAGAVSPEIRNFVAEEHV